MKKRKCNRFLTLLLACMLVLSTLTACSSEKENTGSSVQQSDDTQQSGAQQSGTQQGDGQTGEAEAEGPRTGGVLTIAFPAQLTNIGFPIVGGVQPLWASKPAIEMLGRYDENGQVYGWLAKEILPDPDNLQVVLKLQEGVKYHDGTPFNAQAVCDVWQIFIDNGSASAYFGNIESFQATGEYEVTVKLTDWRSSTVSNLCIECGTMISPAEYNRLGLEGIYTSVVGTGPYVMESYDIAEGIKYVRNDDYWIEGQPYLDGIDIIFYTEENTGESIFRTGEAQMIFGASASLTNRLSRDGFEKICNNACISPTMTGIYFASGNEDDPISKLEVRQAFSYALDKQALCDTFAEGIGFVSEQLAVPGSKEYNEAVTGYPYDVEKAKEKLREAGYEDGECVITIYYQPANEDMFVAVKGMLEAAGFKVEGDTRTGDVSRNMYGTTDPWTCCAFFWAPTTVETWHLFFGNPPVVYAIDTIDMEEAGIFECYNNCLSARTAEEQHEAMMELQRLATEEYCLYTPMFDTPALINFSDGTVRDHGMAETWLCEWTPEAIWLSE